MVLLGIEMLEKPGVEENDHSLVCLKDLHTRNSSRGGSSRSRSRVNNLSPLKFTKLVPALVSCIIVPPTMNIVTWTLFFMSMSSTCPRHPPLPWPPTIIVQFSTPEETTEEVTSRRDTTSSRQSRRKRRNDITPKNFLRTCLPKEVSSPEGNLATASSSRGSQVVMDR